MFPNFAWASGYVAVRSGIQKGGDFGGLVCSEVGAPVFGVVGGGDVAPHGQYGFHACVAAGLYVAFGIADVQALVRGEV